VRVVEGATTYESKLVKKSLIIYFNYPEVLPSYPEIFVPTNTSVARVSVIGAAVYEPEYY